MGGWVDEWMGGGWDGWMPATMCTLNYSERAELRTYHAVRRRRIPPRQRRSRGKTTTTSDRRKKRGEPAGIKGGDRQARGPKGAKREETRSERGGRKTKCGG